MTCLISLLLLIAIPKAILLYLFWEDAVCKSLNSCRCPLQPTEETTIPFIPELSENERREEHQEIETLRQQIRELTAECERLHRKNADLEQVLEYIREIVFRAAPQQ